MLMMMMLMNIRCHHHSKLVDNCHSILTDESQIAVVPKKLSQLALIWKLIQELLNRCNFGDDAPELKPARRKMSKAGE